MTINQTTDMATIQQQKRIANKLIEHYLMAIRMEELLKQKIKIFKTTISNLPNKITEDVCPIRTKKRTNDVAIPIQHQSSKNKPSNHESKTNQSNNIKVASKIKLNQCSKISSQNNPHFTLRLDQVFICFRKPNLV